MSTSCLFEEAVSRLEAANREDARTEDVEGRPLPREWLFAQRVVRWVRQLSPNPSEALLLAAWGHTLRRWQIPREQYPQTTPGYHQWRDALAQFHAEQTETILREVGYPTDTCEAVRALITKSDWPGNSEACTLEDADCLVFLEHKLAGYVDAWGDEKTVRILRQTVQKMTPGARSFALRLPLGPRERDLVLRVVNPSVPAG